MLLRVPLTRVVKAGVRNAHPSAFSHWAKNAFDVRPEPRASIEHLRSTMAWLKAADDACPGGGVSGGYSLIDGWLKPYPETTGYIIPTFYDYAEMTGENEWRERARAMADWEIDVQMPNGAVQAGLYKGKDAKQVEAVFNTGQVILGWCRAFAETEDNRYLDAAKSAGDWLISVQGEDGAWRFESQETETNVHAYDVRTAWSLLEIYAITGAAKYVESAKKNLDWTLAQQHENGWFGNNAFFTSAEKWSSPFTHNIAYVMEGLQESYRILHDERYLTAYAKTAEKLLLIFELRKKMAGDFDQDWKRSTDYSCLTGNAQIAGVWLKHYKISGDIRFLNAALKLADDVKRSQNIASMHRGISGGVQGSYPINGKYTPMIFPNWAAKFLADTLILEEKTMEVLERKVLNGESVCS